MCRPAAGGREGHTSTPARVLAHARPGSARAGAWRTARRTGRTRPPTRTAPTSPLSPTATAGRRCATPSATPPRTRCRAASAPCEYPECVLTAALSCAARIVSAPCEYSEYSEYLEWAPSVLLVCAGEQLHRAPPVCAAQRAPARRRAAAATPLTLRRLATDRRLSPRLLPQLLYAEFATGDLAAAPIDFTSVDFRSR